MNSQPASKESMDYLALFMTDKAAATEPLSEEEISMLLKQARWHRVHTIIYPKLLNSSHGTPPQAQIKQSFQKQKLKALAHTKSMFAITKALSEKKVGHLWLKGPVLSQRLYNDPCFRSSRDIDVLINHKDLYKADEVLSSIGFKRQRFASLTSPENRSQLIQFFLKDIAYVHSESNVTVELHWRWEVNPYMLELPVQQALDNKTSITIQKTELPVLNPIDEFIYLCMHGTKSSWARMCWLHDIYQYIQRNELDWDSVAKQANVYHAKSFICIAITLVELVFKHPIPLALKNMQSSKSNIRYATKLAVKAMQENQYPTSLQLRILSFRLKPSIAYKVNMFYRYLLSIDDAMLLPSKRQTFWLFFMIGPLLFLYRLTFNKNKAPS